MNYGFLLNQVAKHQRVRILNYLRSITWKNNLLLRDFRRDFDLVTQKVKDCCIILGHLFTLLAEIRQHKSHGCGISRTSAGKPGHRISRPHEAQWRSGLYLLICLLHVVADPVHEGVERIHVRIRGRRRRRFVLLSCCLSRGVQNVLLVNAIVFPTKKQLNNCWPNAN